MKKTTALIFWLILTAVSSYAQTPVSANGKLKIANGLQLVSECGNPVQLRGMSSHGLQWQSHCISSNEALTTLKNDWGADVIRLAIYIEEGGYKNNPAEYKEYLDHMVDLIGNMGMYVMLDWHILQDGDPNINIELAKDFWAYMSAKHKGKKHVLYEICNEPNGRLVTWAVVARYARVIIPIIRANDPETIIIVGTPEWSGRPLRVYDDPLLEFTNIMYSFHFYSGTHNFLLPEIKNAAQRIPVFATEWGTGTSDGRGTPDEAVTNQFMEVFKGDNNGKQLISWINWSYSQVNEGSAALKPGSCDKAEWNNVSVSGAMVKKLMNTKDAFISCPLGFGETVNSASGYYLFPNPANDILTLKSDVQDFSGKKISIFNAVGVKVKEYISYSKNPEMDIKNLTNGVYTVKVPTEKGEINLNWIKN